MCHILYFSITFVRQGNCIASYVGYIDYNVFIFPNFPICMLYVLRRYRNGCKPCNGICPLNLLECISTKNLKIIRIGNLNVVVVVDVINLCNPPVVIFPGFIYFEE